MGERKREDTSAPPVTISKRIRRDATLSVGNDWLLWDPFALTHSTPLTEVDFIELEDGGKVEGIVLHDAKGRVRLATLIDNKYYGAPTQLDGAVCYALVYLSKHTGNRELHFESAAALAKAINMPGLKPSRVELCLMRLGTTPILFRKFLVSKAKTRKRGTVSMLGYVEIEEDGSGITIGMSNMFMSMVTPDECFSPLKLEALHELDPLATKWYKYLSAFSGGKKSLDRDVYKISELFGMNLSGYKTKAKRVVDAHIRAIDQVRERTDEKWIAFPTDLDTKRRVLRVVRE